MSQLFTFIEQIRSPDAAIAESGGFDIPRIALRFIRAVLFRLDRFKE